MNDRLQERISLVDSKLNEIQNEIQHIDNFIINYTGPTGVTGSTGYIHLMYIDQYADHLDKKYQRVNENKTLLESMLNDYNVGFTGAHYDTYIDIQSRFNGKYDNALEWLMSLPNELKENLHKAYQNSNTDEIKECTLNAFIRFVKKIPDDKRYKLNI
tara:strand:- start:1864 stop:2337 length:474 start_codon:yes stop_codon:yes gene_type:complete